MTSVKLNKNIPIEPIKKKRTALENISNANSGLNKENSLDKKARYLPAPIKKSDSSISKSKGILTSSKENLNIVSKAKSVTKSEPKGTSVFVKKPKTEILKTELSETIEKKLATTQISQSTSCDGIAYEDIDTEADEFNCTDYAASIFEYYRARDNKFKVADYIKEQPHINKQCACY